MLNAGADGLDAVATLAAPVPVVGQILLFSAPIGGFCVWVGTQFWLIMKGGIGFKKQATYLTGSLVDLIPIINALPTRTATLLLTIYLINKAAEAEEAGETEKPTITPKEEINKETEPAEA